MSVSPIARNVIWAVMGLSAPTGLVLLVWAAFTYDPGKFGVGAFLLLTASIGGVLKRVKGRGWSIETWDSPATFWSGTRS